MMELKMFGKLYYFDTSIWIDIYDKRGYNGEMALKLMYKIINDDDFVLYSDVLIYELKKLGFSAYELNLITKIAKPNHIKRIHSTKKQVKEAVKLAKQRKVPLRDAFHALIARDHGAQLVSRDWDFVKLKDICIAKKPEDLF
jgi:predicted nucleic acid-binding protein